MTHEILRTLRTLRRGADVLIVTPAIAEALAEYVMERDESIGIKTVCPTCPDRFRGIPIEVQPTVEACFDRGLELLAQGKRPSIILETP